MTSYENTGAIDCSVDVDTSSIKGKTAIVTGGANGIGEAYVRALVEAGAFVIIADLEEENGIKLADELGKSAEFVKCDVTNWKNQLEVFQKALSHSPTSRIDIVVPNAGIASADPVYVNDSDLEEPEEPKLDIVQINGIGVLYTVKLALHYFRRQHAQGATDQDANLVLQGSLAGYLDLPGSVQYAFTKYGLRGMMKTLRRTELQYGIRVNNIAPWYVKTRILTRDGLDHLQNHGMEFATREDAAAGLLRIVGDKTINGRTLTIIPRLFAPKGYLDMDVDDYPEGDLLHKLQQLLLST